MATGLHLVIGSLPLLAMSVSQEPELWARIAESGLPLADWGLLGFTSIFGGAVVRMGESLLQSVVRGAALKVAGVVCCPGRAHAAG